MQIRPARPEDADAVFGLLGQLAASFDPDRAAFDRTFADLFQAAGAQTSTTTETLLLVVEDDEGVVRGYALTSIVPLLYTNGPAAQIHELVIDEAARGQDLGSQLVHAIEQECLSRGVRQLTVASRRAAGFYDRLGYHSTAEYLKRTF
ncbi:GNAT family N-acetyltransferase [Lysobacter korlensis]|uniref:GNAT family N-acetyltransferase n=1 Tax=Lysobacter korlensis TaxID=553636 RepID=A0ABV6RY15_9GAMM